VGSTPTLSFMKLAVEIRDTQQNLTRVYHTGWKGEFSDFIWSEGNYSCDCNRSLFFQRASGKDEMKVLESGPEDPDYSDCNVGPNRFHITIRDEEGKVLYED
jgi:hypothetical protein